VGYNPNEPIAPEPADHAATGDLLGRQAEEGQVEGVADWRPPPFAGAWSPPTSRLQPSASSVRLHGGRVGLGCGGRYAGLADREMRKTEIDFCDAIWVFGVSVGEARSGGGSEGFFL
jgi:hypothetical protein